MKCPKCKQEQFDKYSIKQIERAGDLLIIVYNCTYEKEDQTLKALILQ